MEKAKEVVSTIDRFHQLSLDVPGVVVDLQIATLLALRELLFAANFNDVVHFPVVGICIYKMRANKFSFPTVRLVASESRLEAQSQRSFYLIQLGKFHPNGTLGHQRILNGTVDVLPAWPEDLSSLQEC
jgi:hypothetical protein